MIGQKENSVHKKVSESVEIKAFKLYPDVILPEYGSERSACVDIRAYLDGKNVQTIDVWEPTHFSSGVVSVVKECTFLGVWLPPRARALIPTGIILEIPEGYSVRAHPRSGWAVKIGLSLANCTGVIDQDFREELKATVVSYSDKPIWITHQDRISQLEVVKDERAFFTETSEKPARVGDRASGFGSTGVK